MTGTGDSLTPRTVVAYLDRYIVGQDKAKRAVAVALRNRWRRAQVADPRWHANKSYADGIADYTEYRHNWYPIPSKELATNFSIKQNPLW